MGANKWVLPVIRFLSYPHEDFKERIVRGLEDRVQHFHTRTLRRRRTSLFRERERGFAKCTFYLFGARGGFLKRRTGKSGYPV